MRLRGRLERSLQRDLATDRDFDVVAARELEDRPRVDADLLRIHVAGHTGHGEEVPLG